MLQTGQRYPRILLVDDEQTILDLYREVLCPSHGPQDDKAALEQLEAQLFGSAGATPSTAMFDVEQCLQGDKAVDAVRAAIEQDASFSAAFLDVRMPPGPDGVWAAEQIRSLDPNIEIIIVTGYSGLDPLEIARRVPPADKLLYIHKPLHPYELRQFATALSAKWRAEKQLAEAYAMSEARVEERTAELAKTNEELKHDIAKREKMEKQLRESEEKYRTLFEESKDVVFIATDQGQLTDINSAGVELFEYSSKEELLQADVQRDMFLDPGINQEFQNAITRDGFVKDYEVVMKSKNGRQLSVLVTASAVRNENGDIAAYRGILRDVTERKQLQQQLFHAQKMESIGTLAGGIAHDFNNLLGGILGYVSLIKSKASESHPFSKYFDTIEKSATRAAELTGQLLAFARGGKYDVRPVNVNSVVNEMLEIMGRTIDKSIKIETHLLADLPSVEADAAQLGQVVMNLCVNSRDAMPDGGRMIIETSVSMLDEDYARTHVGAKPGIYVTLSITDTGIGIDKQNIQRIFEPFFTTKEEGKGTGLGLAMVYGVVKNHGGHVTAYSEKGEGATFRVYLPANGKTEKLGVSDLSAYETARGENELILVVDDEESIRSLVQDTLEGCGYRVLTAENGLKAIETYGSHKDEIGLVILDMVMPKMGGGETFLKLKEMNPKVRALLSTGYSENGRAREILDTGVMGFLQKPYRVMALISKVRVALDSRK